MAASDSTASEVFKRMQEGVAHHQAGRFAEALRTYHEVLQTQPDHADALNFGALAANSLGRRDESLSLIRRVVAVRPNDAILWNNFGELLRISGRMDESIERFRRALSLNPSFPAAHNGLGNALRAVDQIPAAIEHFRNALALSPDYAEALCNLGDALTQTGDYADARKVLDRAVTLAPRLPQAWNNLGNLLKLTDLPRAIECYKQAIAVAPDFMAAYNNLGTALHNSDRLVDAGTALGHALRLAPNSADAHQNLSLVLGDQGLADDAARHAEQAVKLAPMDARFHNNLARAHVMRGEFDKAVEQYRIALKLRPSLADVHSNLLLTLSYGDVPAATMLAEHRAWAELHAPSITPLPHDVSRDPDRRLRVGYVSPDFRDHAAAHFIEPVLAAHDREQFEVFCYSNQLTEDDVTRRLRGFGDTWRTIANIPDLEAAELIRRDRIDILVDLAGHTGDNRLKLFALKPAPLHVTWIGYPNTSGLSAMDYWITDAYTDPPGQTESFCTERLLRLPETFACYAPPRAAPEVAGPPIRRNGYVTFASFNNLIKLTDDVIALWARLLRELPTARLLIATRRLQAGQGHGHVTDQCRRAGMPLERVTFLPGQTPSDYLRTHNEVDVVLDSFPFTGHTITLNALWMGVPVVTLAGNTHVSRRGVSVLNNLGLPELIAESHDDYVRIAKELAGDLARMTGLRSSLRERLRSSPLMDSRRFADNVASAFRSIWREYCSH